MLHTKLTSLKNWTLHSVCWLTTTHQGCDPITSVTMNVNVIHWTEPSITWILHIGSLAIPICKCFFCLDHSCKKTSDCMTQCNIFLRHWICQWLRTKTCFSLKFYPIMWCKSWFYSWYFGFAFYLGVYHKCHIPLCHWVVTLSHITRTSAMARDIFFPEKSISIEYYNFMNNACMHFLCKMCKAKPARKSSTRTVMLQFKI